VPQKYSTTHFLLPFALGVGRAPPALVTHWGSLPTEVSPLDKDVAEKVNADIEEELKLLHDEINKAFTSTGFECHTSPIFSPANPESSIEDCLAHLGDKVYQELDVQLQTALLTILNSPLQYEVYKEQICQAASHTTGWNKVLVSLVLLQQLLKVLSRRGEQPLKALLHFGVKYIEEFEADYIIQQGGWGTVFSLDSEEEEEEQGETADDSNDIYILTSDNSGQVSPPEPLTVTSSWQAASLPTSLSTSQSWHTEVLPASLGTESWQQLSMDPEDVKSVDSNGGGEERSENNSSNSDIVHVEKEEIIEAVEESQEMELTVPVTTAAKEAESLPVIQTASMENKPSAEAQEVAESAPFSTPAPPATSVKQEKTEHEMSGKPSELLQSSFPLEIQKQLEEFKKSDREEHVPEETKPEGEIGTEEKVEKAHLTKLEATEETFPPEGENEDKSILFYGGAAVVMLVVAVGVALALRKK
uniref:BCL2 like 13 n=1 Tax=Callorhinchus milii TaxID=7868 RepID=A0A4W3IGL1_CALMI